MSAVGADPLLSIVIPTHERARYALPTLRGLLETLPSEVEFVVTDTSEADDISRSLQTLPGANRVRVVRPGPGLSVVDNFNAGMAHARGDYVLFLGDDDFVMPAIVPLLLEARQRGVDAIKFSFPALFHWPDFMHKRRGAVYAGTLHIGDFSGAIREHDPLAALRQAARNLGGGVGDMPRAYAGVVSRQLLAQIQARYGAVFGGVSPDIYSATLIAIESRRCVYIDFPVIVPGSSGASTAGQSAQGRHVGRLRDNAHIAPFRRLVWNPLVPEFYSVPTVWSYSLLAALAAVPGAAQPAIGRLMARCFFYHRNHWAETFRSMRHWRRAVGEWQAFLGLARGMAAELGWIAGKLRELVLQRLAPQRTVVLGGLTDTRAASAALLGWLAESRTSPQSWPVLRSTS